MSTRFRNPANSYEEEVGSAGLWCLLFGCFYLAAKGAWGPAVIAFFLAVFTGGFSWLIYPFFARRIVEAAYLRRGWVRVDGDADRAQAEETASKPCPACAEQIRVAARVCRFCGHQFSDEEVQEAVEEFAAGAPMLPSGFKLDSPGQVWGRTRRR